MTTIIRGSQVTVTFSLIAFSHSAAGTMYSYNGLPCLLTIIAGTGMILSALDNAILNMALGEETVILIPAVEGHQTARALGVNILGSLKYELKVLQVVNTPTNALEVSLFLKKRRVSLGTLLETKVVKKGPFSIVRSYEMLEANAISEEYRILESLHKEYYDKQRYAFRNSTNSSTASLSNFHNDVNRIQMKGSSNHIQLHSIDFYNPCDNSTNTNKKDEPQHSEVNKKHSPRSQNVDIGVKNDRKSRYLVPSWPVSQAKELFLPELLRLAATKQCKIIVLFDAPEDWNNITEQLRKTRSDDVTFIGDKNLLNTSSDDIDSENKSFLESEIHTEEKLFVEADIDMFLESEETDVTNTTVSTWLRISIEDDGDGKNSNNNDIQGEISNKNDIKNMIEK